MFGVQMKCKDWFILTEQIRDKFSANALPSITTPGHDQKPTQTRKKKKEKAGKAMYKISKINTIFIIDMLQNKVP